MAKFVLIYNGGGMAATEAEQAESMRAWGAWFGSLGSAVVDGGTPLAASKSIAPDGTVTDGPIGTPATGYSIIEADSLDAAAALAGGCPILRDGGQVTVYETVNVM
jgi:hypothetical protein